MYLKEIPCITLPYLYDVYKFVFCLLVLPKESLGYTAPMGVPPKVQPMFVTST